VRKGELYMGFFEKVFDILDFTLAEAPRTLGVFHIVSVLAVALVSFLILRRFSSADDKTVRRLTLIFWIIILALEIYKQLVYTVSVEDGIFSFDYQWYAFPFQFCSSPIYVLPLIAFLPSGRARDFCIGFMGTFSLFAGLCVMVYPGDVFIKTLGIDIQTMVHHGSQVVLGIFYTVYYFRTRSKESRKRYHLGGIAVFGVLALTAITLNVAVYHAFVHLGIDETFNMFFISPYFDCTLPVLSAISPLVPYPVFVAVYILGFAAASSVIFYASLGIDKLISERKKAYAI
jgi:hypothetical protein